MLRRLLCSRVVDGESNLGFDAVSARWYGGPPMPNPVRQTPCFLETLSDLSTRVRGLATGERSATMRWTRRHAAVPLAVMPTKHTTQRR